MSGIMEKFFGKAPNTTINPNIPTAGNVPNGTGIGSPATETSAANGVIPANTGNDSANTEVKPPLAEFGNLWNNIGSDGKPVTPVIPEPLYKVDPKQLMDIAGATDFKSVVTPEVLAAMVAGGEKGVAAAMEAMQKMSQAVYANSAVAATKIAEAGITKAAQQFEARLPAIVRNQSVADSLSQKNPALRDPAVVPIVEMIRNQMSQKYPNATAQELQDQAERYFLAAGEAFKPAQVQQEAKVSPNEDWDTFFKM